MFWDRHEQENASSQDQRMPTIEDNNSDRDISICYTAHIHTLTLSNAEATFVQSTRKQRILKNI